MLIMKVAELVGDEEIFVVAAFETAGVDGTSVAVLKERLVLMAHPQLEL